MTPRDRLQLEAEFVALLRERWRRGAREYGDASFDLPLAATARELLDEVADLAGWGFVLWVQLRRRLARVAAASAALAPAPGARPPQSGAPAGPALTSPRDAARRATRPPATGSSRRAVQTCARRRKRVLPSATARTRLALIERGWIPEAVD